MENMHVVIIFASLFCVGLVFGCTQSAPTVQENTQIANPASVYCEEQGGTLEIRTAADGGQRGYCKFSDGSECEAWAYYRGECKPGSETKAQTAEDKPVSAKEWYPAAKEYAQSWNTDAQLYEVRGSNEMYGTKADLYPADGRADMWDYYFVSVSGLKRIKITVRYGEVAETAEPNIFVNVNELLKLPADSEWKIDSYSAANTVSRGTRGKEFLLNDPKPLTKYRLTIDGVREELLWEVSYSSKILGQTLSEKVNAVTNKLM